MRKRKPDRYRRYRFFIINNILTIVFFLIIIVFFIMMIRMEVKETERLRKFQRENVYHPIR